MKHLLLPLLWVSLVVLAGCSSSVSVTSDYDPSADFSGLKSYQWIKLQGTDDVLEKAPLVMKRAMVAVDRALATKGFTKTTNDPDFYVAVHAGVKDKIDVTNYGYNYGGWYGRYGAFAPGAGQTDVRYYKEGTIFVDIIKKTDAGFEMMWRGAGTGTVNPPSDPQEAQAKADEIAMSILEQFPPSSQ